MQPLPRESFGPGHYLGPSEHKRRALNPETGNYLHCSAACEVASEDFAWFGTREQFEKLKELHPHLAGFKLVPRTPYKNPAV